MTIYNLTKAIYLEHKYKVLHKPINKIIGLMFSFKPKTIIMVFIKPKKVSLHMLCVFKKVYAVYLNNEYEVIEKKELKPWIGFYKPMYKAKYIIEFISQPNVDLGNKINFKGEIF